MEILPETISKGSSWFGSIELAGRMKFLADFETLIRNFVYLYPVSLHS